MCKKKPNSILIIVRSILKYSLIIYLTSIAFHSFCRFPAVSMLTGGLITQGDMLRHITAAVYAVISVISDWLSFSARKRGRKLLRVLSVALPLSFFLPALLFFAPQLIFSIGFEKISILTIFLPIGVFILLWAGRKISLVLLIPLIFLTIAYNFEIFLKSNRGFSSEEMTRIVSQKYIRPLVLTPSLKTEEHSSYSMLPGLDVQDILVHPEETHLFASTGSNYEDDTPRACTLVRINLDSGSVEQLPIGHGCRPMALDLKRNRLFVGTDLTDAVLFNIDLNHFQVTSRHKLWMKWGEATVELFLLDPEEDVLWIFYEWGRIEKWRLDTLEMEGVFAGQGLHEYLYDKETCSLFYQTECVPPGMIRYRLYPEPMLEDYRLLPVTHGMAWAPELGGILSTDPFLGRVWITNPVTLELVGSFSVKVGCKNIAFDKMRNWLYIGNYLNGYFYIIDIATKKELAKIFVGQRFRRIIVTEKSGLVFANTSRGVFQIDVAGVVKESGWKEPSNPAR